MRSGLAVRADAAGDFAEDGFGVLIELSRARAHAGIRCFTKANENTPKAIIQQG